MDTFQKVLLVVGLIFLVVAFVLFLIYLAIVGSSNTSNDTKGGLLIASIILFIGGVFLLIYFFYRRKFQENAYLKIEPYILQYTTKQVIENVKELNSGSLKLNDSEAVNLILMNKLKHMSPEYSLNI